MGSKTITNIFLSEKLGGRLEVAHATDSLAKSKLSNSNKVYKFQNYFNFMKKPKSLVNDEIVRIFGGPSFLAIDMLIENIKLLKKYLPSLNKEKNFFQDVSKEFVISKKPKDIRYLYKNVGSYFSNCINWNSPRTQFNITPPVTIPSVAASALVSLTNPNMVWDIASGGFAELEREISKYFSDLVGWNNSSGIFTFGGTGTNMYAIKIGINKSDKTALRNGVKETYVISNDEGHSCHITICNWLGIGTNHCIRLKTSKEGEVTADEVIEAVEKILKEKKKVACIILNGGTNFNGKIDPIYKIAKGIEDIKDKYKLDYKPHIHVDSVIGWVFLLFKGYDFEKNELNFPSNINNRLKFIYEKIKDISFADSFGVDFHKTGFCPYISSLFITKDKKDWRYLSGDENLFTHQAFNFGNYKPGQFTLETSRPANGIVTAYITINVLGLDGMRKIIANFLYIADDLRNKLEDLKSFEICNHDALGWATLFIAKKNDNHVSYSDLYETDKEELINESNKFQKDFYDFLVKKYDGKLPWAIGFSKCYKRNKYGFQISALKSYPMSPSITIKDNNLFVSWLNKNLKEFKNETDTIK